MTREICNKERPMPEKRDHMGQQWMHMDVEETDTDSDYWIEYKCLNCGIVFRTEMPD